MSKKEIAKKEVTQEIQVFTETKTMGVAEEVTSSDIQMPSVILMQANSEIVKDRTSEIKSGDFVHSNTKEIMGSIDEPLELCVVDMFKTQVVTEVKGNNWVATKAWEPEMEKAPYTEEVDGVERKNQKCYNYVCFRPLDIREVELPTGEKKYLASPIVVKFKGASGKNAKKFNQLCKDYELFGQPSWCVSFNLVAREDSNEHGSFFVYDFEKKGQALKETQMAAAALCEMSQAARAAGNLEVVDMEEVSVEKSVNDIPNYAPQTRPVEKY
ncbi:MAG: hypothetical protein GY861_17785 [bacterium]|nr:hypothetical protein [bacterium]